MYEKFSIKVGLIFKIKTKISSQMSNFITYFFHQMVKDLKFWQKIDCVSQITSQNC